MTRPSYSMTLPGRVTVSRPNGSEKQETPVTDAEFSQEVVSGTSRRKPSGWLAPTNYNLEYRSYRRAYGTSDLIYPNDSQGKLGWIWTGVIGSGGNNSLTDFNACMSESQAWTDNLGPIALAKARAKLKSSSVNLGIAYAERSQTARLLGDTAIRIADSYRNLRRGRFRAAMDALGISRKRREPHGGSIPRKWLELQYGWKPLLSDVYGAADALSKRPPSDWRVTAKATSSNPREASLLIEVTQKRRVDAVSQRRAFVRIDAIPNYSLAGTLSSLGITNPLLVAWELVPFSFVVDWAFPVGDWLEGLDTMLQYESAYTSQTTICRANWQIIGLDSFDSGGAWVCTNSFRGYKRYVKMVRSASSGVPIPALPGFKDPGSFGHMANGLSLLAQAFGRR